MDSRRKVTISNSRRGKMDDNRTPQAPSQSHAPSSFMPDITDTPPRADVDEILRRKRKAREYKVRSHARPLAMGCDAKSIRAGSACDSPVLPLRVMGPGRAGGSVQLDGSCSPAMDSN